ncbi:MAG: VWA domain-containing protein [Acidobacteriota bacterium]
MAEPEDLIIDAAHLASRLAGGAWRRHVAAPAERVLRLTDVRVRLELVLTALFEMPVAVTAAEPPAPLSWLGRLAGRVANRDAAAGTDGVIIYLPPSCDAADGYQTYLLLGIEQAARLARGSTALGRGIEDSEVRDRFLIADAIAVDGWIVRQAPGLVDTLRAARADALTRRAAAWPRPPRQRAMEALVRELLGCDPLDRFEPVPLCATASDALAWAQTLPPADRTGIPYRGVLPAWYWGRPHDLSRTPAGPGQFDRGDTDQQPVTRRRVAEMRRRPRIREPEEGEDDTGAGTWVIRADDPQESVEDPCGLQRPADCADDADTEGLGDSLAELPEARVVRTPGQAKEILRAGDQLPRAAGQTASRITVTGIPYPEWDFRSGRYRHPGAIVRETTPALGDPAWVESALARRAALVRQVRTRFERLKPRSTRIGRQPDGCEVDLAEYVNAAADARAGAVVEDRLYIDVRPGRRDLTVALLVDVSASTDSWVSGHQRIVDVEKDALLVVCEALAIFSFSGEGAERVSIVTLKAFTERDAGVVRRRIAALEADGYTRAGAAIRHATAALSAQPTGRRLLLMLSDGKPNDVDAYEGPYGIEDARQAVAEARAQGVEVFCLTVDREAPRYAPRIFGAAGFSLLRRPDQLPAVLIELLRRLIRP